MPVVLCWHDLSAVVPASATCPLLLPMQLTVQLVDSFVVPKMSPTPIKPDPVITQEDLQNMPANFKMMLEAYTRGPKAIWDMPGAVWGMAVRQLPDKHQEMLKKLPKIPQIPTLFAVDVKVRKPDQP